MTQSFASALSQWASQHFHSLREALCWLHAHRARITEETPLFDSAEHALSWAYRAQPVVVKTSSLSRMMGEAEDTENQRPSRMPNPDLDRKPVGLEAAAQIGFIKGFVGRLPPLERQYIVAKYAFGRERTEARRQLRDLIMPLLRDAIRPRWIVYQLVCRHYGRRVVYHALAERMVYLFPELPEPKQLRHAYRVVRKLSFEIDDILKDSGCRASELAHAHFQKRGVIK